jgi:hypothetical protein
MSFTLSPGTTVTGANWWGGCFPGTCSGSQFELNIYSNSTTGGPLSSVDFMPVLGAVNETATGQTIGGPTGWPEYSYSATFTLSTPLTPGTLYWFVIQEIDTEPSGTWGGETTSGPSVPGGEQLQQYDTLTSGWAPLPENVAFELTGTVAATPLPAALPLFTTGLGVVGLFGWRRKRKAATSLAGA